MLAGSPEDVLAEHEVPAYAGVAGVVGLAVADLSALDYIPPAHVDVFEIPDGLAVFAEEDAVVADLARSLVCLSQLELALQNCQGAGTQFHLPVLVRLRPILVLAEDDGLVDFDDAFGEVAVVGAETDLLRLTQAGEETELILSLSHVSGQY